ncbi:MAG: YggS family pyridoxal phosphate-dependent enzyme [Pseudomonadota bacterium]|nr:YggS family pyridoxal phosphate-dependent enzyme [Pseudomonadota bacterium]
MTQAADRLQLVRDRIAAAAKAAGRDPASVTLVAVSKGRSAAAVEQLIVAGQRDFGENRVQEAQEKWPTLRARYPGVRLHEIGQLQSNKAAEATALFDVIHSIDRLTLIDALAKAERRPDLYVQVNIGAEDQKGGCAIADVPALVAAVRDRGLPLLGLMAIPPLGFEPAPFFALLAKLAWREGLSGLSMGMSSDYRAAVMLGATCVRVGSALFDD